MTSSPRSDGAGSPRPPTTENGATTNDTAGKLPGVPGFRTWTSVYWFVLGCFVAMVVLLTVISRMFA